MGISRREAVDQQFNDSGKIAWQADRRLNHIWRCHRNGSVSRQICRQVTTRMVASDIGTLSHHNSEAAAER
jgi:hypothetical protein